MERLTERAEIDKCPGIWVKEGFANEGNKTWFNGYDEGYSAINKCADYEDLEEQGKLLKLPCAVGDTVWYWDKEFDPIEETPFEGEVLGYDINITRYGTSYIEIRGISKEPGIVYYHDKIEIDDFGETVFLTREAAEAALKELERGKHERAGKDLDSG